MEEKYIKIIDILCEYFSVSKQELISLTKNKDNKYLALLLLRNNNCFDKEKIIEVLDMKSTRSITYSVKKAEEKFFINKAFRDKYFEMEEKINKII